MFKNKEKQAKKVLTEKRFEKILSKRISILFGLIVIIIVLISGTFAFQQLGQAGFNPDFVDVFPGGRLHDISQERGTSIVNGQTVNSDIHGSRNKNIFAENFGDVPIGVRVQFREFLELHGTPIINLELPEPANSIISGGGSGNGNDADNGNNEPAAPTNQMDLNNVSTWSVAQFEAGENGEIVRRAGTTAAHIGGLGISWELGDTQGKYFMPTFNRVNRPLQEVPFLPAVIANGDISYSDTIFYHPFVYQFTDASGRSVDALAAWFDISYGNGNGGTITYGNGNGNGNGNAVNEIRDIENYGVQTGYSGHNGSRNFWLNNPITDETPAVGARTAYRYSVVGNELVRTMVTHYAQPTMTPEEGGVMLMSAWNTAGRPEGNFWIFDDYNAADGWFYWNGFIPGMRIERVVDADGYYVEDLNGDYVYEEIIYATSLLISSTALPVHSSLGYVIHVNADFFTANSMPDYISDQALRIFNRDIDNEEETLVADGIMIFSDLSVVTNTHVVRGAENHGLGNFVIELRSYEDNEFQLLDDAYFFADFVETVADGTTVTFTGNAGSQVLQINIAPDEPLNSLTIVIGENRTDGYLLVPITLFHP